MKTGADRIWLSLSAAHILSPGLPTAKAGTAEEERGETRCQGHQQQSAGWGPRCPAPAQPAWEDPGEHRGMYTEKPVQK